MGGPTRIVPCNVLAFERQRAALRPQPWGGSSTAIRYQVRLETREMVFLGHAIGRREELPEMSDSGPLHGAQSPDGLSRCS